MTCPLQAKFQFEDNLPYLQNAKASFGTCIHKSLEDYNLHQDVDIAIEMFKDNWAHPENLRVKPDYWPRMTNYNGLKERGIEILKAYHDVSQWQNREVIATEHAFMIPFGDHELSGIVDLVELKKAKNGHRTLRIIDYKTNSRQPNFESLRFDIQFTIYYYASLQPEFWTGHPGTKYLPIPDGEERFQELASVKRKAVWYHLWTGKEIDAGARDDGDFERLYRLVDQVSKAKEMNAYIPTINGESCLYCSYTDQCRYVIPVKNQMLEEEYEDS